MSKESKHIKQIKKRKRRILKLRKNHLAGTLLSFVVISLLAYIMMLTFVTSFFVNILEQNIEEAFERTQTMVDVYDRQDNEDRSAESLRKFFPESRDYFIMDENENILLQNGAYTIDLSKPSASTTVLYGNRQHDVTFHADIDAPKGMENPLNLENEPWKLLKKLYEETSMSFNITGDSNENDDIMEIHINNNRTVDGLIDGNKRLLYYHYWLSIPLKDGKSSLYLRSDINITAGQVAIPMAMILAFAFLMLIFLVIVFSSLISLTVSKNKLAKLYFTDIITRGHNQNWLDIMGEKYLSSSKNAYSRCAVLNIFFANYRNLCLSLNAGDGEEMLRDVYKEISRFFGKKGCFAHCTASNFAAVVLAEKDEAFRSQLPLLVTELENLSKEHTYCFQIGVDFVEKVVSPHGLTLKRDFADISEHYSNACTARETLSETDESGIAYFDEKLVEEQKWINTVNEKQQLALNNEEFVVYYQPKYDPRTNVLRGAEALIRWQSPEYGFVTPNRMIPIFEKNGFITEIDHYMITHVARDQKRWLDAGFKCVPVSVNVSRAHFIESDLAEQIRNSVDEEGAPHDLIEIELTESAFFDDKKAMISTIEKLKSYGFTVSMDDFGSGYSSLNSLKDMPLDVLKLDAEFFRGDNENGRGDIVVSEAIKLAKSLKMRTVAEGVEIKEQVDFLAGQGCDMIQGYYYSKPVPSADFEEKMKLGISEPDKSAENKTVLAKPQSPAEDTQQQKESKDIVSTDRDR